MAEVGIESAGEQRTREILDATSVAFGEGDMNERITAMDFLQQRICDSTAEELLALENFVQAQNDERARGNASEHSEEVCKRAIANSKLGMNMRSGEYVKGLVAKSGLKDKVMFHRLSSSHDETENGKEIRVYMTLDFTVKQADFQAFLDYAKEVEGLRVGSDSLGRPCLVFPVENLLMKKEDVESDKAIGITEDVGAELKEV